MQKEDTQHCLCMSSRKVHKNFSAPKFDKEPKKEAPFEASFFIKFS